MCGRNSRPKRVSGFVLCCEVCALQLQATCKTSSQTRHDLIQPGVHSVACSNTKRLPVPCSKDETNARKLQLLQTSSLSGVPSSRFPALPTGIVALLLMGRSVCACTSASSSVVVQAHILAQEQEKNFFNCSYGRQHQLWLAFVMQNSGKKITQGGWEFGRIFGLSFVWGRLVSGTVIHMTADDAWEDAPQLRGAVSSLMVCETGVDWDWDEPDLVWLINMWCTERPELPNWDSAMNKSIFEEQTSELSRFSKKTHTIKT